MKNSTKLRKYFEKHYNSIETESLASSDPEIELCFQTKDRIITLSFDKSGSITEDFRMRRGYGTKAEYLRNEETKAILIDYYNDFYAHCEVISKVIENGVLKIRDDDKIYTLTVNKKNEVEVKERMRKGANKKPKTETSVSDPIPEIVNESTELHIENDNNDTLEDDTKIVNKESKRNKKDSKPITIIPNSKLNELNEIEFKEKKPGKRKKFKEDEIVKIKYTDTEYKVLEQSEDLLTVKVLGPTKETIELAISDLA